MSRTVNINEEFVVVSEGKKDIGKFAVLGNDGKFDPSVIPGMEGFEANLSSNGYQKLPSGLIIQWGASGNYSSQTNVPVVFPTEFPSGVLSVMAQRTDNVPSPGTLIVTARSKSSFTIYDTASPTNDTNALLWFAIGC